MSNLDSGTKQAYYIILSEMVKSGKVKDYLILHDLVEGTIYPMSKGYLIEKDLMTESGKFKLEGFMEYAQSVLSMDEYEDISIADFED